MRLDNVMRPHVPETLRRHPQPLFNPEVTERQTGLASAGVFFDVTHNGVHAFAFTESA